MATFEEKYKGKLDNTRVLKYKEPGGTMVPQRMNSTQKSGTQTESARTETVAAAKARIAAMQQRQNEARRNAGTAYTESLRQARQRTLDNARVDTDTKIKIRESMLQEEQARESRLKSRQQAFKQSRNAGAYAEQAQQAAQAVQQSRARQQEISAGLQELYRQRNLERTNTGAVQLTVQGERLQSLQRQMENQQKMLENIYASYQKTPTDTLYQGYQNLYSKYMQTYEAYRQAAQAYKTAAQQNTWTDGAYADRLSTQRKDRDSINAEMSRYAAQLGQLEQQRSTAGSLQESSAIQEQIDRITREMARLQQQPVYDAQEQERRESAAQQAEQWAEKYAGMDWAQLAQELNALKTQSRGTRKTTQEQQDLEAEREWLQDYINVQGFRMVGSYDENGNWTPDAGTEDINQMLDSLRKKRTAAEGQEKQALSAQIAWLENYRDAAQGAGGLIDATQTQLEAVEQQISAEQKAGKDTKALEAERERLKKQLEEGWHGVYGEKNGWKYVGTAAAQGLTSVANASFQTINALYRKGAQALYGDADAGMLSGVLQNLENISNREMTQAEKAHSAAAMAMGSSDAWRTAGNYLSETFAAVPDAVLAIATAIGTGGGSAAVQLGMKSEGLASAISGTVKSLAKDPFYWTSFAREFGPTYYEAIDRGESEDAAMATAAISGLLNAVVEIGLSGGSGMQGLPEKLLEGSGNAVLEWVKSALEEGGEEVVQGAISRLTEKAISNDITWEGDTESVANFSTAAQEFSGGFVVGLLLGGGQMGVDAAYKGIMEKMTDRQLGKNISGALQKAEDADEVYARMYYIAKHMPEGSESAKAAQQYGEKNFAQITDGQLGAVYKEMLQTDEQTLRRALVQGAYEAMQEEEKESASGKETQKGTEVNTAQAEITGGTDARDMEQSPAQFPQATGSVPVNPAEIRASQPEGGVKGDYARTAQENTGTAQGQERSAVNAEQNTAGAEQIAPEAPVKLRSDTDVNLTTYAQDLNAKRAAALRRRVADAEAELASPAELGVVQGETETRNRIVPESIAARDADLQEARGILNGAGYTDTGFVTGQIERYGGTDHYALTKDGKALIQADSVWYTPQELAQTFVQQYGEKKGAKGNGTAVYDTDGGRVRGERAGGETERVAESTDAEAGVSKAERGNGTGNPQTDAGNAKVSAAGLGIKNGTDTGNLKLIVPDADGTYADARVQQAAEFLNQFGIEATFVSGNILVRNPYTRKVQRMLAAVTADGRVVIRADAQKVTPLQLAKHEAFHMLVGENPGMRQQILEKLFEDYEEEEVLVLARRYVEGYEGIYGTWEDEADRYIDEMLADAYAGINRTFAHAAKYEEPVRSYVEENGMTPGSGEKTEAYSIVSLPDGKKYVQADRQVLFGSDMDSWKEQLEDYINGKIRRGQDVQLLDMDGNILLLTSTSAGKLSDYHTSDGRTMDIETYARKGSAAAHIDELVEVSKRKGRPKRDRDGRHGEMAKNGWEYRTAYFRDFDGKYYIVTISAAKGQGGNMVYNVGNIKEEAFPRIEGSYAKKGNGPWGNAPDSYYAADAEKVNRKFLEETDGQKPFSAGEETVEEKQRAAVQEEITARYKKIVHEILSRKKIVHGAVLVGYTPKIYRDLGMPELPFVINGGHVYSIAKTEQEAKAETGRGNHKGEHYHGLGESVVADIMEFVQDPVMIIAAKDVDPQTTPMRSTHSIVALIDVGSGKNSLVIPIAITAERSVDGVRMDVNAISSAYEKNTTELVNEAIAQFNIGENSVFYVKKEAESLIGAGIQFPEQLKAAASSDGIVRRFDSKINMSVKKFTESKQFKRWFGDWQNNPGRASKIVNADGTPKRVYHGTDKKFRVFRSKSGVYWFSESRDYAEAMAEERGGDRVEEVYLNIRNPYYAKLEPGKFSDPNYEKALIREAKKRGCDGLIIQNDTDNELEAETFYVAFKPNQIKSATDNVGTFSTETEDIYFSAGEETVEVPEYLTDIEKTLEQSGAEVYTPETLDAVLKDAGLTDEEIDASGVMELADDGLYKKGTVDADTLKEFTRIRIEAHRKAKGRRDAPRAVTAGEMRDAELKARRKLKSELLGLFPVPQANRADTARALEKFAQWYMESGEKPDADEMWQQAMDVFGTFWNAARMTDESGTEVYGPAAQRMKGVKIRVPESAKTEFGDDWNDMRRKLFGAGIYVTDAGIELDTKYQDMSEAFPGMFDEHETDGKAQLEKMLEIAQAARPKALTLEQEAKRQGIDAEKMMSDYLMGTTVAIGDYMTALGAQRQSWKTGVPVGMTIDELTAYLDNKAKMDAEERIKGIAREDFRATPAMEKLGIRIENSVTGYGQAMALKELERARRRAEYRAEKEAERRGATQQEKAAARAIARGEMKLSDYRFGGQLKRETVQALSELYGEAESFSADAIAEHKRSVKEQLRQNMEELIGQQLPQHKPGMAAMNYMTPKRICMALFGDAGGQKVYDAVFRSVSRNGGEMIRWVQAQKEKGRFFRGADGKEHKLSKGESRVVQMMMEGRAARDSAAKLNEGLRENITNAAEDIYKSLKGLQETKKNYKTAAQNAMEDARSRYGLSQDELKLAYQMSRMNEAQELVGSLKLDAVKLQNALDTYRDLFDSYYDAINDFLVVHGYEPIGFIKGYAPHMQTEESMNALTKAMQLLGGTEDVSNLPVDIAGLTQDFRPGKKYDPYFLQRTGVLTAYDIQSAFDSYLDYLGQVFYRTDDIMRVRALSSYIRENYAPDNLREMLEWNSVLGEIPADVKRDWLERQGAISRESQMSDEDIEKKFEEYRDKITEDAAKNTQYGNLVMWLDNYANILAGKQSAADRGNEQLLGRRVANAANRMTGMTGAALVGANMSSVLNQTSQLAFILSENRASSAAIALKDIVTGKTRAWAAESDFLMGKKGVDMLAKDAKDMADETMFALLTLSDRLTATMAVRTRYVEEIRKGTDPDTAMRRADEWARDMMGSRMKGERPLAFESKRPLVRAVNMFQTEVLNSWEHVSMDLPREIRQIERTKGRNKAALAAAHLIIKTLLAAFVMNRFAEEIYGGTPAMFDVLGLAGLFVSSGNGMTENDWIRMVIDNGLENLGAERIFGTEREEKKPFDTKTAAEDTLYNVTNDIPLLRNVAGLMGWGDETLPTLQLDELWENTREMVTGAAQKNWRGTAESAAELLSNVLPGGRQLQKTLQGAQIMLEGGRYKGTDESLKLLYPVDGTVTEWIKALMFGRAGVDEEGRYWAEGRKQLSEKQTKLYRELVDDGADRWEVYNAIQNYREIEADEEMTGSEKDRLQREMMRGVDITDKQKLRFYAGMTGAESRSEQFGKIMETGVSFNAVMDIFDQYQELYVREDMAASEKALEFANWLDQQAYTEKQKGRVREQLRYFSMVPAEAERYDKLTAAGLGEDTAYKLTQELTALEPEEGNEKVTNAQMYSAILNSSISEEDKAAAIGTIMGTEMETDGGNPTSWANLQKVLESGLTLDDWYKMYQEGCVDKFVKYMDDGISGENAMQTAEAMDELTDKYKGTDEEAKDREKWMVIAMQPYDEYTKSIVLEKIMREDQYKEYSGARSAGITTWQYVKFKDECSYLSADKDADGKSISGSLKKKVVALIDSMDISKEAKDYLYLSEDYAESGLSSTPWH